MDVHSPENTELTTTESVARETTKLPVQNFNTEKEMDFDYLTIPGDYIYYDILEEEKGNISLNDEVWVKANNEIWRVIVMLLPYSNKKEDSEHLEII